MRLLIEGSNGDNLLVAAPAILPHYAIGTEVEVVMGVDEKGEKVTESGVVVGYKCEEMVDTEADFVYFISFDELPPMEVAADDIDCYYPSTNEFCMEYYTTGGSDDIKGG